LFLMVNLDVVKKEENCRCSVAPTYI